MILRFLLFFWPFPVTRLPLRLGASIVGILMRRGFFLTRFPEAGSSEKSTVSLVLIGNPVLPIVSGGSR